MKVDLSEGFDGFLTREGELVSIEDVDRISAILAKGHEDPEEIARRLRAFAGECFEKGRFRAAYAYLEKALPLLDAPDDRADFLLLMGQALENARDFPAALETYARGVDLPQEPGDVSYFLNNNLGFCLNKSGRHEEAERRCRAAISINPQRYNAHKNLGIALQGLGRYAEAIRCYMRATQLAPMDPRALNHVEDLLAGHGDIVEESPGLREELNEFFSETSEGKDNQWVQ